MKTIIVSSMVAIAAMLITSCSNESNTPAITAHSNNSKSTDSVAVITTLKEMFTCTMHNEVLSNNEGTCPKCGMKLVKQKLTPAQQEMYKQGKFLKSKEEQ